MKAHQEGPRIIPASRVSRSGNKPLQLPLHFPSLSLSVSFHFFFQLLISVLHFSFLLGADIWWSSWWWQPNEGSQTREGCSPFFLTLWPSDRKNKFCYAVRIYFQLCSPSNLLLIFSPHQASETCCTWVFRRKGRLCPTDFKWLLQCKCAQSRRGGSSSSASDTSPGSICYTDAPQCKECLRSVLPAAPHSSLRQPGAVGSRNISRQRVWSFLDHLHLPAFLGLSSERREGSYTSLLVRAEELLM